MEKARYKVSIIIMIMFQYVLGCSRMVHLSYFIDGKMSSAFEHAAHATTKNETNEINLRVYGCLLSSNTKIINIC